ncbi:hypothetical protein AVEN_130083-1 [Araneus ventricosus]|uniref:Uncharacterized protein n=1 Tax=Araneus ventricosus TaxID=182803 RepID=A0A4Y2ENX9_ARAVE|nr:hypothetical protein AVEN_130083-1 [Araneus ventricosus]
MCKIYRGMLTLHKTIWNKYCKIFLLPQQREKKAMPDPFMGDHGTPQKVTAADKIRLGYFSERFLQTAKVEAEKITETNFKNFLILESTRLDLQNKL